MKFSEQIKTVRESLGLNQAEAAAILGCGKRTLEHWEAGTRTPLEITQEGAMNRLRAASSTPNTPQMAQPSSDTAPPASHPRQPSAIRSSATPTTSPS